MSKTKQQHQRDCEDTQFLTEILVGSVWSEEVR